MVSLILGRQITHSQQEVVIALDYLIIDGKILFLSFTIGHVGLSGGFDSKIIHLAKLCPVSDFLRLCLSIQGIDIVFEGKQLTLYLVPFCDPSQVNLPVSDIGCFYLGTSFKVCLNTVCILYLWNGSCIGCNTQGVLHRGGSLGSVLVTPVSDGIVKLWSQVTRTQFHDLNLTLLGGIVIVGHGLSMGLNTNEKYSNRRYEDFFSHIFHLFFMLIIKNVSCFHPSVKGFCCHLTNGFGTVYLSLPITRPCLNELPCLVIGTVYDVLDAVKRLVDIVYHQH